MYTDLNQQRLMEQKIPIKDQNNHSKEFMQILPRIWAKFVIADINSPCIKYVHNV